MPRPTNDLPDWASSGNYSAPGETWDATARRVATGLTAFANAGLEPEIPTPAQSMNEWLARVREWIVFADAEGAVGVFGDGSDGDVTVAGTTTLVRDMFYDDLTIGAAGVLETAGFRVFVRGTLTITAGGIIRHNGAIGSAGGGGGGGAGGAGAVVGFLAAAGAGATGGNATANGSNASAFANNTIGGAGGNGGNSNNGGTGGTGGTPVAPTAAEGGWRFLESMVNARTASLPLRPGLGGGGGGGGTNGTGGGGGGGGGAVVIAARLVANAGSIQARGGVGGAAYTGPDALGNGGGGGGGGGFVFTLTRGMTGAGTIDANGGAGGAGHLVGAAGATGSAGVVITLGA